MSRSYALGESQLRYLEQSKSSRGTSSSPARDALHGSCRTKAGGEYYAAIGRDCAAEKESHSLGGDDAFARNYRERLEIFSQVSAPGAGSPKAKP